MYPAQNRKEGRYDNSSFEEREKALTSIYDTTEVSADFLWVHKRKGDTKKAP